ncbi:UNVERIFIED_CONTAM: hypothetical protein QJA12_25810, partial [Escherichia coli]
MPTVPISMRKLKEILRLKYGVGLSHRQIGRSLAISPSVVSRYANRAAQLGIKQWPLPTGWDDTKLKHAFLQTQVKMKKLNRPGFPGECFICELRLPDHRFRWKHNKLFLLLPEEYGPAFP